MQGYCEASADSVCEIATDCPKPVNSCALAQCVDQRCTLEPVAAGAACRARGGAPGHCEQGICNMVVAAVGDAKPECERVFDTYYDSYRTVCEKPFKYSLEKEELRKQERNLEKKLAAELHYDMAVRLVSMPGGGYNIVTYNRRGTDDLRGVCDPSFVAFTVAQYTRTTNWRSRGLNVWLRPGVEGWTIPTSGSRTAVRKGQQASNLGWLGVVDVEAFRRWLEKAFRPIPVTTRAN